MINFASRHHVYQEKEGRLADAPLALDQKMCGVAIFGLIQTLLDGIDLRHAALEHAWRNNAVGSERIVPHAMRFSRQGQAQTASP
jgi:hypothetical protein